MCTWQFFVPFWGWLSDHLERLSDLQLGNQKVTLNHLEDVFSCSKNVIFRFQVLFSTHLEKLPRKQTPFSFDNKKSPLEKKNCVHHPSKGTPRGDRFSDKG